MGKIKDISGQRFGNVVVLECTGEKSVTGNYIWSFLCDCGNTFKQPSGNIVHRKTGMCLSCSRKLLPGRQTTHGMAKTKEYKSWLKARERTRDESCESYAEYGAVGIGMSDEFFDSFESFISYMGKMPTDGKRYTLGRINNNLGYVRGNIRWETDEQQARNKGFQSNNSSGKSGVTWDNKKWEKGENLYACAQWHDLNKKFCKKSFAVKTYGLLPAFKMACEYREQMIKELNAAGAGYSETHGK